MAEPLNHGADRRPGARLVAQREGRSPGDLLDPFQFNLRHLRAAVLIQKQASVGAAARLAHISQPALTQGLAKLERQFGEPLFERSSAGMVATAPGRIVLERIEAALDLISAAVASCAGASSGHAGRVITMTQLRALLLVADGSSFAAAAKTNNRSQTSLHRAVSDLEHVLGKALFDRKGRLLVLNAAGRQLVRGARLAGRELRAALTDVGADAWGGEPIVLGASPLSRPFLVPEAVARMLDEQPLARFRILEGDWDDFVEALRDGVIDIVVGTVRPLPYLDIAQVPVHRDHLVTVGRADHPLAGRTEVDHADLCAYPWIVGPVGSPARGHWERIFGSDAARRPVECGSAMVVTRLLTRGDYLALLSPSQIGLMSNARLLTQIGPAVPASERMIGIAHRMGWRPTRAQRRFIEVLQDVAKEEFDTSY